MMKTFWTGAAVMAAFAAGFFVRDLAPAGEVA